MKKYICEFVGTMTLTLVACGVAVITSANVIATSLAFGLVIVAMAYSIGNVSGCHINPAVSLGFVISGKMSLCEFAKYVVAQVLGALAGSGILAFCLESTSALGANDFTKCGIALVIEIVLTFIFVTTILGVTDKKENSSVSGIVIGLTLTLVHLFGINFTGTSVNPARSLAPALLQGGEVLANVWVFIIGPFIGSTLAGLFYKYVLKSNK